MAERLEARVLYSADLLALGATLPALNEEVSSASATIVQTSVQQATATQSVAQAADTPAMQAPANEWVFIDARINELGQLLSDFEQQREQGRSLQIVLVDGEEDALHRISETLAESATPASAIHLIGHGSDASLRLGASKIDAATVRLRAAEFAGWSASLSDDADLMIYGCDFAASTSGQWLVNSLAMLTGADVAASTDTTGALRLGGDWALEYQTGLIDSAVALDSQAQAQWDGTLATFVVSNVNDSGAGSLRAAVAAANLAPGADVITFNIAGAGQHTINLASALPLVNDTLDIDARTQPGYAGTPLIVLNGNGSAGAGIYFQGADNSAIRGLVIQNFANEGIALDADNVTIQGNWIGTSANGMAAAGNANGIAVYVANNIQIGGATAATRNVISGNNGSGISLQFGTGHRIQGNYIGVAADGLTALGNGLAGVEAIPGANANTLIGGQNTGEGNIIANHVNATYGGVEVGTGTTGVAIIGNSIYNNRNEGIALGTAGHQLNDGGDPDGGANNQQNYPVMLTAVGYDNRAWLETSLNSSPNTSFLFEFFANSAPDPGGFGEGQRLLFSGSTSTDATGRIDSLNIWPNVTLLPGEWVSATVTRMAAGVPVETSRFGNTVAASVGSLTVTNNSDIVNGDTTSSYHLIANPGADGISLREAILAANATNNAQAPNLTEVIRFAIPGAGVHTITPTTALPAISEQLTIDGTSQPGYAGTPLIELDGVSAGALASGLTLAAGSDDSEIAGMAINRFGANGITISGSDRNLIRANFIGTNATGTLARANTGDGIRVDGSQTIIGGTLAADRNVISGNGGSGIRIASGASGGSILGNHIGVSVTGNAAIGNAANGIWLAGGPTTVGAPGGANVISGNGSLGIRVEQAGHQIQSNLIGIGRDLVSAIGNQSGGIYALTGASNLLIGGVAPAEGNTIANSIAAGANGVRVASANSNVRILSNAIYNNADIGIDLNGDGITLNDPLDPDTGANNLTNTESITSVTTNGLITTISHNFNALPSTPYRVEWFLSPAPDPTGNGEGQTPFAWTEFVTDAAGNFTSNVVVGASAPVGQWMSATATRMSGTTYVETSEFSTGVIVTAAPAQAYEGFYYPAGNLNGDAGGSGFSNGWSNLNAVDYTNQSGSLTDSTGTLARSGGHVESNSAIGSADSSRNLSTSSGVTGGTLWASFLARSDSPLTPATWGGLSFGGAAGTGTGGLIAGLNDAGFYLGRDGGGNEVFTSAIPSAGTTYLMVVRIDFAAGNDTATLYVDPTPGLAAPDSLASRIVSLGAIDLGSFTQIGLNAGLNKQYSFDEIRIGSSFAEVTPLGYTVSGTIYEDVNGDAALADAVGRPGVALSAYRDDGDGLVNAGDLLTATTSTDGNGDYAFTGLANGEYWIVVDSTTLTASAGLRAGYSVDDIWAEQTYGSVGAALGAGPSPTFLGSAGALYGGRTSAADNASALATAEHMTRAVVADAAVNGVDSAFSFNVVSHDQDADVAPASNRTWQGSLRQFVQNSNAITGVQSSQFRVGAGGTQTIALTSELPTIVDRITLSGNSQTGFAGQPLIVLNGSGAGVGADGLTLASGSNGSVIEGLVINRFSGSGIIVSSSGGSQIRGNYIGTDQTGSIDLGNAWYGISMTNAVGVTIGGMTPAERNVISGNDLNGLYITGAGSNGNQVFGNYIGMASDGATALANASDGIAITGSATGTLIGSGVVSSGNLISGNLGAGVLIVDSTNNQLVNNIIGLNAAANATRGNALDGIRVAGNSSGNRLGMALAVNLGGNLIAGNLQNGILLSSAGTQANRIDNNRIGTNAASAAGLGNGGSGIEILAGANGNLVGGIGAVQANEIAYNGGRGVLVNGATSTGNAIRGNSIHDNALLGIDLQADGVTANDGPGDPDAGSNALQNYPVLVTALQSGPDFIITGSLPNAGLNYSLDFYSSPTADASSHGEASTYLGSYSLVTGGDTAKAFTAVLSGVTVPVGRSVTATATAPDGSTSEFAVNALASNAPPGIRITLTGGSVTSEAPTSTTFTVVLDSTPTANVIIPVVSSNINEGSVSAATLTFTPANWNVAQTVTVTGVDDLLVDGNRPYVIALQPASSTDPAYNGLDASDVPLVNNDNDTFNRFYVTNTNDLRNGDPSSIAALLANDGGDGISLREAIEAANSTPNGPGGGDQILFNIAAPLVGGAHTIQIAGPVLPGIAEPAMIDGNSEPDFSFAGDGTPRPVIVIDGSLMADSPGNYGLAINPGGSGSTIRGLVIQNSGDDGLLMAPSSGNIIIGNMFGTDVTGTIAAPNAGDGIDLIGTSDGNQIGGLTAAEGNLIAFNGGNGIDVDFGVGNRLLGNRIHDNGGLGIDLGSDGVTANDPLDADSGANNRQNTPVLSMATTNLTQVRIQGSLQSQPSRSYRIEFFGSTSADPSGSGEAAQFLGAASVTTDAAGNAIIDQTLGVAVPTGRFITATAIDDLSNDSSEFAVNVVTATANSSPVVWTPPQPPINEDTALVMSGANAIFVTDSDAGAGSLRTRLSVGNGVLTLAGTAGLTFLTGDGSSDPVIEFTGTLTAINLALDGLRYDPAGDFNGAETLAIVVDDQGNTGNGGPNVVSVSLPINVLPVNDGPTLVAPVAQGGTEDLAMVFAVANANAITFGDVDAGSNPLRIGLSVSNARIDLASLSGLTLISGTGSGDAAVTFEATVANANAALNGLRVVPNANFNGADTLQITYNDLGNSGSGGALGGTASVALNFTAVNDAPTVAAPGPQATPEDTVLTLSGASTISIADIEAGAAPMRLSLSVGQGDLTLAGTAGLTFSSGDGTADPSMIVTGSSAALNAALNGLSYRPSTNFNGTDTLSVTIDDLGNLGSGGAQLGNALLVISVGGVNDPPLVSAPAAVALDEDQVLSFGAATGLPILLSDPDAASAALEVSLSVSEGLLTLADLGGLSLLTGSGAGDSVLSFTGSLTDLNRALASLAYRPNSDFNGADVLAIRVSDLGNTGSGGARLASADVALTIRAINDAPVISVPLNQRLDEDTPLVLQKADGNAIQLIDMDAGNGLLRLSIDSQHGLLSLTPTAATRVIEGNAGGAIHLLIEGTLGELNASLDGLRYTPDANWHGTESVRLEASDLGNTGSGGEQRFSQTLNLTVAPVNDAPEDLIRTPALSVVESAERGTSAGTIMVNDVDDDSGFLFTLLDDAGHFSIDPATGALSVASANLPDHDRQSLFPIVVQVSDPQGATIQRGFLIQGLRREQVSPNPPDREVGVPVVTDPRTPPPGDPTRPRLTDDARRGDEGFGEILLRRRRVASAGQDDALADFDTRSETQGASERQRRRFDDELQTSDDGEESWRRARSGNRRAFEWLRTEIVRSADDLSFELTSSPPEFKLASQMIEWSPDSAPRQFLVRLDSLHTAGFAVSAGLMLYLVRSGSLIAAMLASVPAWSGLDPLVVLRREREDRADADSADEDFDTEMAIDEQGVRGIIGASRIDSRLGRTTAIEARG